MAAPEPDLLDYVNRLDACDFVLAIGYRNLPIAKLEILVPESGKPALFPDDANIIGVVTGLPLDTGLPVFRPDEIAAIADFVAKHARLKIQ